MHDNDRGRENNDSGDGKITLRWSSVRNLVAALVLASSAIAVITTYTELRTTTYSNAARIIVLEQKLNDHVIDVKVHTEKTVIKETKEDLLQRIDSLQKQVDNANVKLDRILLRGK